MTNELLDSLVNKWVVVDTNFILHTLRYPNSYFEKYKTLENNLTEIVTVEAVAFEVLKGFHTIKQFDVKKDFIDNDLDAVLSTKQISPEEIKDMVLAYSALGTKVSYTDFILAGLLKQYRDNIVLLTTNFKDFPCILYDHTGYLNVSVENSLHTYIFAKFSQKKYDDAMVRINKTKEQKLPL